ncbi:MAG: hypothetical protein LBL34_05175 [Clostridiales bacterium]|jgi:hypothetical protein|nr:hypothetical protein [Clostridiales bacterium]
MGQFFKIQYDDTIFRNGNLRKIGTRMSAAVILAMLLPLIFIMIHANHNHDHSALGGECSVCQQLDAVQGVLNGLKTSADGLIYVLGTACFVILLRKISSKNAELNTSPISLKVRLNN